MAAATRSKSKNTDTRKDNVQPNHMPEALRLEVLFAGRPMIALGVGQSAKLSDKGNIGFNGGIRDGWVLPGDAVTALTNLSFRANGVELHVGGDGVHTSDKGNLTVGHFGTIDLPGTDGIVRPYRVKVYATNNAKKEWFNLSASAYFSPPPPARPRGPQVTGQIEVIGDGFELLEREEQDAETTETA